MKTAAFLQKEIDLLVEATAKNKQEISSLYNKKELSEYDRKEIKKCKAAIKRDKSRQSFLKTCLLYIKTEPNEDYLKKEVDRISNRINLLMTNYTPLDDERCTKSQISTHKKNYEKEMGVPKIRTQLTTINFLLN